MRSLTHARRMLGCCLLCATVLSACGDDGGGGPDGGGMTPDELAAICAVVGACTGRDATECSFELLPSMSDTALRCVQAAGTDCDAVQGCLGFRITPDPGCTSGRSCLDADTVLECTDGFRAVYDCRDYVENVGPNCVTTSVRTDCGGHACTVTGERTCDGDLLETCDSTITEVLDCSRLGLTCEGSAPVASCGDGVTSACTPGTMPRCDGRSVVICGLDGDEDRLDCSRWMTGMTCVATGPGAECALGGECTAAQAPVCNGTVLSFCLAGLTRSVDCTTLGFAVCRTTLGEGDCAPR